MRFTSTYARFNAGTRTARCHMPRGRCATKSRSPNAFPRIKSDSRLGPDRKGVHYLHGGICGTRSCGTSHLYVLLPCRLYTPVDGQGTRLPVARHGHLRLRVHTQSRAQILDLGACLRQHLRFLSQGVLDPFALARTEFGGLGTHLVALWMVVMLQV